MSRASTCSTLCSQNTMGIAICCGPAVLCLQRPHSSVPVLTAQQALQAGNICSTELRSVHNHLDRRVTPGESLHDSKSWHVKLSNTSLHCVVTIPGAVGVWQDLECQTPAVDTAPGARFLRPGLMLQQPSPKLAACVQSLCRPSVTSRMLLQSSRT